MKLSQLESSAKGISRPRSHRRRSTSLPRLRDRASQANTPLSASHRTGSLVLYLEDLPHYPLVQQGEAMAENQDFQERLIPRAIQEHNGMATELWYWDQNSKTMRKKKLIGPEPIHQSQAYTDLVDMQTTWERYRVFDEDRNPIEAVLWNVIRRQGDPVRILMTMEAFRL